jgi:hypothetical protein
MEKCVIEIVSQLVYPVNPTERRIQSIEWEQQDPFDDAPGAVVYDDLRKIQTYYRHTETGKHYLAFTGGAVWPFLKNPGAVVVIGVHMPERAEDIPALEVMEAALVDSERGLLEKIRDLRLRYGARKDEQILRVWHGPTTVEQYMALSRFQKEADEIQPRVEALFYFTLPHLGEEPDFYRNTVQSIMEALKPGQKRITGLSAFSGLQGELVNLTTDDLGGRIVDFPGVAALCHAYAAVNPAFNQTGRWEGVITKAMGLEER